MLYEGFTEVFNTEVALDLEKGQADHFDLSLQKGMHSGHLKLHVALRFSKDITATLCLMQAPHDPSTILSTQLKSQNLACALIQKPDENDSLQALAYIVSIEKVFSLDNEENVIVKISSLQKK